MSEREIPERSYVVGDEIRLRVTITHTQNIEEITATFNILTSGDRPHQARMTFIGEPDDTEDIGYGLQEGSSSPAFAGPYRRKRSTATLVSLVDQDHIAGFYELMQVHYRTTGGFTVRVQHGYEVLNAEHTRFRVLQEHPGQPDEVVVEIEEDADE